MKIAQLLIHPCLEHDGRIVSGVVDQLTARCIEPGEDLMSRARREVADYCEQRARIWGQQYDITGDPTVVVQTDCGRYYDLREWTQKQHQSEPAN